MSLPTVALVAYPLFEPFIFSIPGTVFGVPMPDPLFRLCTASDTGAPVQGCGGFSFQPDGGLELLEQADAVIVPGWHDLDMRPSPALVRALIRAHERGALVVGLCYGAYVLAYAGLLDGRKASTHWKAEADFRQRFPCVDLHMNSLYVEDGGLVTSAGVGAGVDCCLFLVRHFYGLRLANRIARVLVVPPFREGGQAQFIEQADIAVHNDRLGRVLAYVQAHLAEAHTLDSLASRAAMSRRTFARHFRKATGMSVGRWLTAQRLRRGCELLESTTLSVEEIAGLAGFGSAALFRHHFQARYRVSPRTWRKNFTRASA